MKGILFKEKLFNQILLENKKETRRIVKPPNEKKKFNYGFCGILDNKDFTINLSVPDGYENYHPVPRYKKGEIVYLKEPYYDYGNGVVWYAFDFDLTDRKQISWSNKMFMPKKAARYFIEIEDVRLEALQDITRSSIRREGLICPEHLCSDDLDYNYRNWYIDEWIKLWDKINGKTYPWKSNPPVWVYDFSLTKESKSKLEEKSLSVSTGIN